jgi:hypothetical protein
MRKTGIISFLTIFSLFLAEKALAFCPVCTVAVGAGLGLCRWLGVDDVLSGIWIGGLIVSLVGWTLTWLEKKQIRFPLRWLVVSAFYYSMIIVPLYFMGIVGHPLNTFWGTDKLILGMIFGTLAFVLAWLVNEGLRKMNQGKVFFPFQKVVIPILFLIITTAIFHYIVGCKLSRFL